MNDDTDSVVQMPQREGSLLCVVEFWRRPNGSIQSVLSCMDGALIETTGDDVASRTGIVAEWIAAGAKDMAAQSREWLEALRGIEQKDKDNQDD